MIEWIQIRDVVNEQYAHGTSVISRSQRPKSFLSGGVPLQITCKNIF